MALRKLVISLYTKLKSIMPSLRASSCIIIAAFSITLLYPGRGLCRAILSPSSEDSVVPERVIKQKSKVAPDWKQLWDEGRQLARSGDYEGAVRRYEELLLRKGNLEEAQWELARIWIHLRQPDKAVVVLELLLEISPGRFEYLSSLATIMQEKGQVGRAVDLFIKAHEQQPDDLIALKGIVHGLFDLDKKIEVLPFLEKLYQKLPEDKKIRKELAQLYYELERYDEARPHLVDLAQAKDAPPEIVLMAARVHEKLSLDNLAVDYWKTILARDAGNHEAWDRIARFYENAGQGEKSLEYLLPFLILKPDDPSLLKRTGQVYMGMTRFAEALPYFEKYIEERSDDKEVLRLVADIYTALGNEAKTLAVLERFFALEAHPDPVNLKQAAVLYDASGRYHEAITLYNRLLAMMPNDSDVLARLAKDLFIIGEEESALSLWDQLDRNKKLLDVLEILYAREPADDRVALKLAAMYLNRGDLVKSQNIFEKMGQRDYRNPLFWENRGLLFEKRHMPEHALRDYDRLLRLSPERDDIRLRCVRLSGELGKLPLVKQYLASLNVNSSWAESAEVRLMVASAFRECGAHELALQEYQDILAGGAHLAENLKLRAFLGLAEAYEEAGLLYEAEQTLRMALNLDPDSRVVSSLLFGLSLASGRTGDAEVWLDRLENLDGADNSWEIKLKRVQLLSAKDEHRAAIKQSYSLLAEISEETSSASQGDGARPAGFEVEMALARVFLRGGRGKQAKRQCLKLAGDGKTELEPLVLMLQAYELTGESQKAGETFLKALSVAGQDLGALLRLAVLWRNYERPEEMLQTAITAGQKAPDSLKAKFLLVEAQELNGKNKQAMALLDQIITEYPGNIRAAAGRARLLFKTGRLDEALAQCESILIQKPQRPDIYLLKARILWAQKHWSKAQEIYSAFLDPSVGKLFVERSKAMALALPVRKRRTSREVVDFAEKEHYGFVDTAMTASYAAEHSGREEGLNDVAASLYAMYRWQKQFAAEKAAKRLVRRREYFQAANKYEMLLGEYPAEEFLLFDLAGIYSRLGKLGREAALYERLADMNAEFPGFAEAIQRNRLKRRPRIAAGYGFQKEEGRDGYKNIRKEREELTWWFSPRLQHEVDVSAARINYRTAEGDKKIKSTRAVLGYKADVSDRLTFSIGGGVEALDNGHPDTALFNCSLAGKFGDKLSSNISFTRDVVDDTPAGLTRHVVRQDMTAAVSVNLFSRLLLGGEYEFADYSDGNETSGYELSASYILFRDPTYLKFRYSYDFKDAKEGATPGTVLDDGFARDDHPYWAPTNYWTNRFSLYFKHQLSDDLLGRGIPRYYSAEYSVEYDADGYAIQTWEGGFFVELTPRVIAEASASVTSSQVYRNKEFFLSLAYRW